MQSKLRFIINPSMLTLVLFFIVSSFLWAFAFVGNYFSLATEPHLSSDFLVTTDWEFSIAVYLITLLNAFLVAQQVHNFSSFKKTKGFLPALVFVLLTTSWGNVLVLPIQIHLSLTFFILAISRFLRMTDDPTAVEDAFLGCFLYGVAVTLFNSLLFVLPLLWLLFVVLRCFSLRTFLASLMGFAAPVLLYVFVAYQFFNKTLDSFLSNIEFNFQFYFDNLSTAYWIYSSIMLLILVLCFIETARNFTMMQGQIRKYALLSFCFLIVIIFFCLLQKNNRENFLPFLVFSYAICFSWGFSLNKQRMHTILFLFFAITNIALVFYNFFS